jgi:hypothetical protein
MGNKNKGGILFDSQKHSNFSFGFDALWGQFSH